MPRWRPSTATGRRWRNCPAARPTPGRAPPAARPAAGAGAPPARPPSCMANVEEVTPTGPDTPRWRVKGPFGKTLEWEAQTTQKEQNSTIGWKTIEGEVGTSGQVHGWEAGRPGRTRVEVQMNYSDPPGGKVGEVAPRAGAIPKAQLQPALGGRMAA